MTFDFNEGDRPSRLELGRRATGETQGDVPESFQRELSDAKTKVAPFDWEVLSKHAARLDDAQEAKAIPLRRRMWLWTLIPTLAAAMAIVLLVPQKDGSRNKGDAFLIPHVSYHVQRGEDVFPEGQLPALHQGDRLQFTLDPAGHKAFVLLSVDGTGNWTTYYPTSGNAPVPIAPRPQPLPESIELDAAPGPEVFVAFFGFESALAARILAEEAYKSGGAEGVMDLARQRDDIEVTVIRKE